MFKIQNKEVQNHLVDISLKLVRTYTGEIKRTQVGKVSAFPTSFITVGFDLVFMGPRKEMRELERVVLSGNTVKVTAELSGIGGQANPELSFSGAFSCSSNQLTYLKDKDEEQAQLQLSIVSDGTDIKDASGNYFQVKYQTTTIISNCCFGKVYSVPVGYRTGYKVNGYDVSDKILVLGNHTLVSST